MANHTQSFGIDRSRPLDAWDNAFVSILRTIAVLLWVTALALAAYIYWVGARHAEAIDAHGLSMVSNLDQAKTQVMVPTDLSMPSGASGEADQADGDLAIFESASVSLDTIERVKESARGLNPGQAPDVDQAMDSSVTAFGGSLSPLDILDWFAAVALE